MKRLVLVLMSLSLLTGAIFASGQAEGDAPLQVAATFGDLGNPFFYTMGQGVKDAAREIDPNARVTVVSCGYDLNTQTGQMDTFISGGVDIIVLNAADTAGIAPAVRRAKEAGIVVVAADVNADGGVDATVTSNNYGAGTQAGEYIVKKLGGKGDIVIVNGPPVSAVIDRVQGAKDVFAKYPGINILSDNQNAGGNREGGLRVMSDLLTAFDKIDAAFAINDPTGIGTDLAIQQAKRSGEMFVVGVDGAPDAVVALNDKSSNFVATPSQDPYTMATRAVEVGYKVMQGEKLKETLILIPTTLITRDNVGSYEGWTQPE
ncbi:MAG: ABC transporter substrate-binding protein [Alkalispirochaeta sp.]